MVAKSGAIVVSMKQAVSAYDGLPEPLRAAWMQPNSALGPTCQSLILATDGFLGAAQEAGQAQRSLSGRDLFLSALAIAWAGGAANADSSPKAALAQILKHGWATGSTESGTKPT